MLEKKAELRSCCNNEQTLNPIVWRGERFTCHLGPVQQRLGLTLSCFPSAVTPVCWLLPCSSAHTGTSSLQVNIGQYRLALLVTSWDRLVCHPAFQLARMWLHGLQQRPKKPGKCSLSVHEGRGRLWQIHTAPLNNWWQANGPNA